MKPNEPKIHEKARLDYKTQVAGLNISRQKLIAVYLLLVAPNSSVQIAAGKAAPDPTIGTAATNVVQQIASILGLTAGDQDFKDLVTAVTQSNVMIQNAAGQYTLSHVSGVLSNLDPSYSDPSGCPDAMGAKLLYKSIT